MTARDDMSLYCYSCVFKPVFAKAWVRSLLALAFAAVIKIPCTWLYSYFARPI